MCLYLVILRIEQHQVAQISLLREITIPASQQREYQMQKPIVMHRPLSTELKGNIITKKKSKLKIRRRSSEAEPI